MGEEFLQLFTHSSPLFTHLQFPKKKNGKQLHLYLAGMRLRFYVIAAPPKKGEEG